MSQWIKDSKIQWIINESSMNHQWIINESSMNHQWIINESSIHSGSSFSSMWPSQKPPQTGYQWFNFPFSISQEKEVKIVPGTQGDEHRNCRLYCQITHMLSEYGSMVMACTMSMALRTWEHEWNTWMILYVCNPTDWWCQLRFLFLFYLS